MRLDIELGSEEHEALVIRATSERRSVRSMAAILIAEGLGLTGVLVDVGNKPTAPVGRATKVQRFANARKNRNG